MSDVKDMLGFAKQAPTKKSSLPDAVARLSSPTGGKRFGSPSVQKMKKKNKKDLRQERLLRRLHSDLNTGGNPQDIVESHMRKKEEAEFWKRRKRSRRVQWRLAPIYSSSRRRASSIVQCLPADAIPRGFVQRAVCQSVVRVSADVGASAPENAHWMWGRDGHSACMQAEPKRLLANAPPPSENDPDKDGEPQPPSRWVHFDDTPLYHWVKFSLADYRFAKFGKRVKIPVPSWWQGVHSVNAQGSLYQRAHRWVCRRELEERSALFGASAVCARCGCVRSIQASSTDHTSTDHTSTDHTSTDHTSTDHTSTDHTSTDRTEDCHDHCTHHTCECVFPTAPPAAALGDSAGQKKKKKKPAGRKRAGGIAAPQATDVPVAHAHWTELHSRLLQYLCARYELRFVVVQDQWRMIFRCLASLGEGALGGWSAEHSPQEMQWLLQTDCSCNQTTVPVTFADASGHKLEESKGDRQNMPVAIFRKCPVHASNPFVRKDGRWEDTAHDLVPLKDIGRTDRALAKRLASYGLSDLKYRYYGLQQGLLVCTAQDTHHGQTRGHSVDPSSPSPNSSMTPQPDGAAPNSSVTPQPDGAAPSAAHPAQSPSPVPMTDEPAKAAETSELTAACDSHPYFEEKTHYDAYAEQRRRTLLYRHIYNGDNNDQLRLKAWQAELKTVNADWRKANKKRNALLTAERKAERARKREEARQAKLAAKQAKQAAKQAKQAAKRRKAEPSRRKRGREEKATAVEGEGEEGQGTKARKTGKAGTAPAASRAKKAAGRRGPQYLEVAVGPDTPLAQVPPFVMPQAAAVCATACAASATAPLCPDQRSDAGWVWLSRIPYPHRPADFAEDRRRRWAWEDSVDITTTDTTTTDSTTTTTTSSSATATASDSNGRLPRGGVRIRASTPGMKPGVHLLSQECKQVYHGLSEDELEEVANVLDKMSVALRRRMNKAESAEALAKHKKQVAECEKRNADAAKGEPEGDAEPELPVISVHLQGMLVSTQHYGSMFTIQWLFGRYLNKLPVPGVGAVAPVPVRTKRARKPTHKLLMGSKNTSRAGALREVDEPSVPLEHTVVASLHGGTGGTNYMNGCFRRGAMVAARGLLFEAVLLLRLGEWVDQLMWYLYAVRLHQGPAPAPRPHFSLLPDYVAVGLNQRLKRLMDRVLQ